MASCSARGTTYDELLAVHTPEATETHLSIPHHEVVQQVRFALQFHGHEIVEEAHAVTPDGARYFGLMSLRSPYGDYTDTLGLRNSHDKSFPVGIAFGSRVFVCDNLCFSGDHVIRRKHTAKARRELPALIGDIVAPLQHQRLIQNQTLMNYKAVELDDAGADHLIMEMYRSELIGVQRIADVHEQWQRPAHDWGARRTGGSGALLPMPLRARFQSGQT